MTNPLHQLDSMVAAGMQPVRREVWLGLGFRPPKRCAIAIDTAVLPTAADCRPVIGLDIILTYHGDTTRYGALRALCGVLAAASPRRLVVIDLDIKRVAFLKLGTP
ncbi:hypothetical protein [Massilia sp. DWR3-1-1]|uniref:hypothetical protein n=1 Tax=Massilia sp. DWR3-1-1 TaxID=2804559 RepID=UPI003CF46F82